MPVPEAEGGGDDLQKNIAFICRNKKNVKHISEYLKQVENGNEEHIPLLTGVFSFYIREKTWKGISNSDIPKNPDNDPKVKREAAEIKVNLWLHTAYKSYVKILLELLRSSSKQLTYFQALLRLLEVEYSSQYECLDSSSAGGKLNFPNGLYIKIVRELLVTRKLSGECLEYIKAMFVQFDDLCFYCLKNIRSLLETQNLVEERPSEAELIAKNTFTLLSMITNKNADVDNEIFLYVDFDETPSTEEISKSYKLYLSSSWMAFFHLPKLPLTLRKKVLVSLDSKIMPHLLDPKLLIDFLTDAYDSGGVCSLLALNGLFVLINQYNLDYPEFYTKLYNILDANIFNTKYKARFFYHVDLFLTSTHLPAYLVCAFVKKLTRMALLTPGEDIFMLLKFIKNLLIRHSAARILVHRQSTKEEKTLSGDPFDYEESDPFKSGASKSCLWELETLRSHYAKDVLKLVISFKKEFPIVEDDLSQYLDDKDFESMILSQLDVEVSDENVPPLNFEKKELVDFDSDMWCI